MSIDECETCIKKKTLYCPNSIECMATDNKPYYQNKIMILEENERLKRQQKEFVNYLEDYLKLFDKKDIDEEGYYDCIEEILLKYEEIIGGENE